MYAPDQTLEDIVVSFVREMCEIDPKGKVYAGDLYDLLQGRALVSGFHYKIPLPKQKGLTLLIKKLFPFLKAESSRRATVFEGIRLKSRVQSSIVDRPVVTPPPVIESIAAVPIVPVTAPIKLAPFPPEWKSLAPRLPLKWKREVRFRRIVLSDWKAKNGPIVDLRKRELGLPEGSKRSLDKLAGIDDIVAVHDHNHTDQEIKDYLAVMFAKDR